MRKGSWFELVENHWVKNQPCIRDKCSTEKNIDLLENDVVLESFLHMWIQSSRHTLLISLKL